MLSKNANILQMYEKEDRERECNNLRRVAFLGVAVSTIATLVCVISVPMLYNYMQHMQSVMQNELDFCKSRSGNIWREVTKTQVCHSSIQANITYALRTNTRNRQKNWDEISH